METLKSLAALGADVTIPLEPDTEAFRSAAAAQFAEGVDVVIDYLWGPSAESLLLAAARVGKDAVPIRFVQIGSIGGGSIQLPGSILRSSAIELMGSGIGSVPIDRLLTAIADLLQAAGPGKFAIETKAVPLSRVEEFWSIKGGPRLVFVRPTP